MTIKQRVKISCEKMNINLGELAEKLEIRQSTFSVRLKTGKFTKEEIEKIAFNMGCLYTSYFLFPDGTTIKFHSIGIQIKNALVYAGMTITDLGKKMGITQQAISKRLKTGKFTQDELESIASMIGCKYVSEFVFEDGTKI